MVLQDLHPKYSTKCVCHIYKLSKVKKMSLTKSFFVFTQRLAGATLLVFANKQDLPGALSAEEIRDVSISNL